MARRPSPEAARPVFMDRSPRAWSPASPKMVAPVVGPAVVVPLPQLPVATTWGWKPKELGPREVKDSLGSKAREAMQETT